VKEFAVYTALRLALFVATLGIVVGIWFAVADGADLFISVIIAFILSGVGSYFLFEKQRTALAERVEQRAARASAAFEEMRAKEDERDEG
jgi:uncharacterized membrane protein YfcA